MSKAAQSLIDASKDNLIVGYHATHAINLLIDAIYETEKGKLVFLSTGWNDPFVSSNPVHELPEPIERNSDGTWQAGPIRLHVKGENESKNITLAAKLWEDNKRRYSATREGGARYVEAALGVTVKPI